MVREQNTCSDRLVPVGIDLGLVDEQRPAFASHAGVVLPIKTDTLAAAAAELDLAADWVAEATRASSPSSMRHPQSRPGSAGRPT